MTDSASLIGHTISHYGVIDKIGQGGMGVVYRARDTRLERDVALKVLPDGMLADPAARKRFRNEALALARLNHPNICSVFDFDTDGDCDFLVMEFVPGISLHEKLHMTSPILDEVSTLGLQLASGLAAAHDQGVLHRDLKPSNLRVTPDGRLKILDFGLAKFFHPEAGPEATLSAAETTSISGTVPYMSPEQLRGDALDARTDIYSAGAVLYELATGRRPFPERHFARLIDDILNNDPPPASRINRDVSSELESVLRKALAHKPEDRYQSARELQSDLERLSTAQIPLAATNRRANRVLAGVALLGITVAGVGIGWYAMRKHGQKALVASDNSENPPLVQPASLKRRRSVAVFAIKNVSGRADAAWLSTALSEMLTTELAAGERLRTVPGETVTRAKMDLSLSDSDTFAQDTLRRISDSIGTDAVVSGSYVVVPGAPDGKIRVDLRVQDAHNGEIVAAVSESGSQAELLEVVSRAGAKLRSSLGVPDLSAEDAGRVRGSLPSSPDAARLYAEGLNKLRVFDSLAARDLLEKAKAADPSNAAVRSALATAWGQLGYDVKALEETKKALELSAGLSREARFAAEGRYQMAANNWPKMVEIYQSLFNVFPDNPDYGVQLAVGLSNAGKPAEAFSTLDKVRATISSVKDDPRVDLVEADVADRTADFKRELAAANRAVAQAKSGGERLAAARGLLLSGWALFNLGEMEKAAAASQEAKAAYEAVGDRVGQARAMHNLALILVSGGKLDEAENYYNQAINIRRQIQDNQGLSRALGDLGAVHERRGDLPGALKRYEEGLAIAQKISETSAIATAFSNIGSIQLAQGKPAEARKSIEQSLALFRQIGNKSGVAVCLANLGNLASDAGDTAGARKLYEESAADFTAIGQKAGNAQLRTLIASLFVQQGDYASARTSFEAALAAARDVGDPQLIADAESGSSKVAYIQGDWTAARTHAESGMAAAKNAGDKRLQALTQFDFASSLDGTGELATAKKVVEDGLALARELGDKEVIAMGLHDLAEYLADEAELGMAQQNFEQAIVLNKERKTTEGVAEAQNALAEVFLELNQPARAAEVARESAAEGRRAKNPRLEIQAELVLARVALAQRRIPAAQEALARATTLSGNTSSPSQRIQMAVCTALVNSAAGGGASALQPLQAALNDFGPKADFRTRLGARLAIAKITVSASGAVAGRPLLEAVEKDANEKGFVLYARKAAALRKS
jgi:serine/threonine protein kinase/tetratricopeptide (TPR) repeat protein